MEEINIKYHADIDIITPNGVGDWIDLRAAQDVYLDKGDSALISLGVSMKLPDGYESWLTLRSSTPKKYHIIQKNVPGIIDNKYCGDNDIWKLQVYALEDTHIPFNTRIAQFRIVKNQPAIHFNIVKLLNEMDRGGFGSTGEA